MYVQVPKANTKFIYTTPFIIPIPCTGTKLSDFNTCNIYVTIMKHQHKVITIILRALNNSTF